MKPLYAHQKESIKFLKTRDRVFDMSDPGTAKTRVELLDFESNREKGRAMLVLAPKSILQNAWGDDMDEFTPGLKYSIATADNRAEAFAAKADVYITNHDAVKWLVKQGDKNFWKRFDRIVVDECFVAGTLVDTPNGPTPIEVLKRGTIVNTSSGPRPITNTFESRSKNLVLVEFDDGTRIECTENHPIATTEGWCNAGGIRGMQVVRLQIHRSTQPWATLLREIMLPFRNVFQYVACGEKTTCIKEFAWAHGTSRVEQRNPLDARSQRQNSRRAQKGWAPTENTWGQWNCCPMRKNGERNAFFSVGSKPRDNYGYETWKYISTLLQSRFRTPEEKENIRDRWQHTFINAAKNLGCEARYISSLSRVVNVSRTKQNHSTLVYNLQVDGPHDYSVAGTLVHNCTAYKHHTSDRSRALERIKKLFDIRRNMTGTPNTRSITDIWNQAYFLDDGKRLGASFYAFRSKTCVPIQKGPRREMIEWQDKPGAEEAVADLLSDITIRHKFEDCVDIPPTHKQIVKFYPTKKQRGAYESMERDAIAVMKKGMVSAINAAAVRTKMLQIASGAVYESSGVYHVVDTERYDLVMDLVEARKHSIVYYLWKHQRDEMVRIAKARNIRYCVFDGEASDKQRQEMRKYFQAGFFQMMIAHPKSAAHGLTLTRATATIWPSPPDDLEWWVQGNRRHARAGQTQKTEIIAVLADKTIEPAVYHKLEIKQARMDNLLELMER